MLDSIGVVVKVLVEFAVGTCIEVVVLWNTGTECEPLVDASYTVTRLSASFDGRWNCNLPHTD